MLRFPTMRRSSGDLARALSGVQHQAELAEFLNAAGDSVHRPSHTHREFHVGHVSEIAEAVKDFLLPVGEVLGQKGVGVTSGLGLGAEVPIAATYMNEISKAEMRGRLVVLFQAIFAFGVMVTAFVAIWVV